MWKFKAYNMIWFMYINCKMITTIRLVNTSITFYMCVMRDIKIYPLSHFHAYNTVMLTVVTMLYIRSPQIIHLKTRNLYL